MNLTKEEKETITNAFNKQRFIKYTQDKELKENPGDLLLKEPDYYDKAVGQGK